MKREASDRTHRSLRTRMTETEVNVSNDLPVLVCPNCGFTTKSVFAFTEHYEHDTTGFCEDVHY